MKKSWQFFSANLFGVLLVLFSSLSSPSILIWTGADSGRFNFIWDLWMGLMLMSALIGPLVISDEITRSPPPLPMRSIRPVTYFIILESISDYQ